MPKLNLTPDQKKQLRKSKINREWKGMSNAHDMWKQAKEKAAKAGLDVKGFNKDFGPAFDKLREMAVNCGEILADTGTTLADPDNAELKVALKKRIDKCVEIADAYLTLIEQKIGSEPAKKALWVKLGTEITSMLPTTARRDMSEGLKGLTDHDAVQYGIHIGFRAWKINVH